MDHKFTKHYSRDEARALLPQIRDWLGRLQALREPLAQLDQRLTSLMVGGKDLGGAQVNQWVETLAQIKALLQSFQTRQILIKDLDRGLIDFPTILGGREALLCWEQDEDDIEFWHDLDSGYAGREKLD